MNRKPSSLIVLHVLFLSLVMIISMSSYVFATSRPSTPVIKTITSKDAGNIVITTGTIKNAKGYQVKYSLNKDFSSGSTKSFTGSRLYKKTISGLKHGKTYYVKVRSYKRNSKGKKIYSSYSKVKTVKVAAYVTGYTKDYILRVNTKKASDSASISIPYKAKVLVSKSIAPRKSAQWIKLKYKGTIYYKYAKAGVRYFTSAGMNYSNYEDLPVSEIRQRVVSYALEIFRTKATTYKNTKDIEPGSTDSKGRMQFDCSGFTSYVINNVMQDYIPNYAISNGIIFQGNGGNDYTNGILYEDAGGKFSADKICSKTPDFSKLQPGDLVFFNDSTKAITGKCDHVGIYIGNHEFIHSVSSVGGVAVMPMDAGRYYDRFLFARRFVPDKVPVSLDKTMYVNSPYSSGSNVYSDIKFNKPSGDRLTTGTSVTVKYITPCSWKEESCCLIEYGGGSVGYIQLSLLAE